MAKTALEGLKLKMSTTRKFFPWCRSVDISLSFNQAVWLTLFQTYPHLFPASSPNFSLQAYHVQGSRILSRSFTIAASRAGISQGSKEVVKEDETGEEDEEVAVMVPMADMLNAAFAKDNARLFSDDSADEGLAIQNSKGKGYTMITTIDIAAGEQIVRIRRSV